MAYTSHGHHIPGTTIDDEIEKLVKARCGGPGLCVICSREVAKRETTSREYVTEKTLFKVIDALTKAGLDLPQVERAIGEMQNAGILFREYLNG
jgi:hypothetical protein